MLRDFSKEKFDVILQAGQSNAEGCGLGKTEDPYVANYSVWYLNNDFSISKAQERIATKESNNSIIADFSLPFAREYMANDLKEGRNILIVRAAVGGTGFVDKRWNPTDDLYLKMMDMTETALSLNPENKLVAFLWHQGETDAANCVDYQTYRNSLSTLINNVRTTFSRKDLPFIAGDFVWHWKSQWLDRCEPIVKATKDICNEIGYAEFVQTDDLLSNDQAVGNEDIIHFCRDSIYKLGVRYYNAYQKIVSAK